MEEARRGLVKYEIQNEASWSGKSRSPAQFYGLILESMRIVLGVSGRHRGI